MNAKNTMLALLLAVLLLSSGTVSCTPKRDTAVDVAVIVALTQTAAALQNPAPPVAQPTQPPVASGYVPLNSDACNALNNSMSSAVGYPGVVTPSVLFEDFVNNKQGTGCQISFNTTGLDMENFGGLATPVQSGLLALGWTEDTSYGAGGAGGYATAYRKDTTLCLMIVSAEPSDRALCPSNQPISVCWETLAPEQKLFNLTLNCATYIP